MNDEEKAWLKLQGSVDPETKSLVAWMESEQPLVRIESLKIWPELVNRVGWLERYFAKCGENKIFLDRIREDEATAERLRLIRALAESKPDRARGRAVKDGQVLATKKASKVRQVDAEPHRKLATQLAREIRKEKPDAGVVAVASIVKRRGVREDSDEGRRLAGLGVRQIQNLIREKLETT